MTVALPPPIYMPVPNQQPGQLDAYYSVNFGQDPTFTLNTTGSFNGYNIKAITLHVYNPSNSPVNINIGGGILYAPQNTDNYYDITGVLDIVFTSQQPIQISIDLLNYVIPAGSQAITNLSQSRDQYFSEVIGLYHFIGPANGSFSAQTGIQSVVDNAISGYGVANEGGGHGFFTTDNAVYLFPPTSLFISNQSAGYGISIATDTLSSVSTIEFAINFSVFPGFIGQSILSMGVSESNLWSSYNSSTKNLDFWWHVWGGVSGIFIGDATIPNAKLNTWYYIAFTFIDLSAICFVNGNPVFTANNYSQPSFTAQNLTIGDASTVGAQYHLAELRITNAARYLTNYQVQSYPFPNNS